MPRIDIPIRPWPGPGNGTCIFQAIAGPGPQARTGDCTRGPITPGTPTAYGAANAVAHPDCIRDAVTSWQQARVVTALQVARDQLRAAVAVAEANPGSPTAVEALLVALQRTMALTYPSAGIPADDQAFDPAPEHCWRCDALPAGTPAREAASPAATDTEAAEVGLCGACHADMRAGRPSESLDAFDAAAEADATAAAEASLFGPVAPGSRGWFDHTEITEHTDEAFDAVIPINCPVCGAPLRSVIRRAGHPAQYIHADNTGTTHQGPPWLGGRGHLSSAATEITDELHFWRPSEHVTTDARGVPLEGLRFRLSTAGDDERDEMDEATRRYLSSLTDASGTFTGIFEADLDPDLRPRERRDERGR